MKSLIALALAASTAGADVGTALKDTDRMTNTVWIGDSIGTHPDGSHSQGTVFVTIGKDGSYTATGYYRGERDCMEQSAPWTGRILKIAPRIYAAVNDGDQSAFYVLNVTPAFTQATASLVAKGTGARLVERNYFVQHSQSASDRLQGVLGMFTCDAP